ncbi:hypothetical protein Tco_0835385 [Tanacetum coccineum]
MDGGDLSLVASHWKGDCVLTFSTLAFCGPRYPTQKLISEDSDENGCYFLLTDQLPVSNIRDNRLEAYRWTCLNDKYRFVGREKNVGDWFAGRAAQTQVADYQYNSEALGLGQLVMPVYFNHSGAVLKLAGIIELVTAQHNEFYAAYFNQIQSSLMLSYFVLKHFHMN